jgi:hypothetical protein
MGDMFLLVRLNSCGSNAIAPLGRPFHQRILGIRGRFGLERGAHLLEFLEKFRRGHGASSEA